MNKPYTDADLELAHNILRVLMKPANGERHETQVSTLIRTRINEELAAERAHADKLAEAVIGLMKHIGTISTGTRKKLEAYLFADQQLEAHKQRRGK